jgi:hypothetical protein
MPTAALHTPKEAQSHIGDSYRQFPIRQPLRRALEYIVYTRYYYTAVHDTLRTAIPCRTGGDDMAIVIDSL